MAEPVGITGTAVGMLSFGLQLYTGISEYLDAVKGRDEDLQSAKQYAKMLRDNLVSIEVAISAIGSEYTVARYAIEQCKSSCETELKGLEVLLLELKGPMVEPTNRTEQVKNSLRTFSYPFKKKDIARLQDRLSLTNNAFHTAALALQLAISNDTRTTIVDLQSTINAMHQTTEDTATGMAEQTATLKQANQTLTQSHQELQLISQRMPPALDSRINEILTHLRDAESPRSQLVQLLQYPQDLRRLCDAVSNLRQNSKTDPRTPVSQLAEVTGCEKFTTYRTCDCAARHDVRRQGRRFGLFLFESEIQKTTYHAPECQMSGVIPIATESKRTFGVHIPAMFKLLDRTIRLSFSVRAGAGGYTICQSIDYAATVDESSSISFRIATMLIRLMNERTPGLSNEDFSVVAGSCIRRLTLCYGNKQASPRDLNRHGESILDLLAWQLHLLGEFIMPANVVSYILRSLATTKIPITNGSRVKIFDSDTAHQTVSTLLACCDLPTGQDHQVTYLKYAHERPKGLFENFPDIAENEEEIREIQEEDAAYKQILEELMSDFETEYENRTDLAMFLTIVWVRKMKDIWAKLSSMELTSEEIRSAETVGVIWEVCESEDTWGSEEGEYVNPESWARVEDLRSQMGRTSDDEPSAVEEWMRRLDDIAIDPQRPVIAI
ncbi:hypothetical protein FPRO03_10102 [Fusarium proliferatum]|nr:hypothetical protein FPRO03_10102 [Fusarium proliferatum]